MILARAGDCCEECGVPNYTIITKFERLVVGLFWTHQEARLAMAALPSDEAHLDLIIIVLNISHTDHFPMNCNPSNLRALCQKCHNSHDAKHRAAKRKLTRTNALESIAPSLPLYTTISQLV